MRTPVFAAAMVLALVTLLVLGVAYHALGQSPADRRPVDAAADARAAERFYDAVNATLATGDAAALEHALAPGFVDHGPVADAAGLTARLRWLRAVFPGLRLVPRQIGSASGSFSAWQVETAGGAGGTLLGLPVPAAAAWPALDLLTMRDGRVAERWDAGAPAIGGSLPRGIAFSPPEPGSWKVSLERWDLSAGATAPLAASSTPLLAVVASGTVRVTADGTAGAGGARYAGSAAAVAVPLLSGGATDLATGSVLLLPPGAAVTLDASAGPAALLLAGLRPPRDWLTTQGPKDGEPPAGGSGVVRHVIATGPPAVLPDVPLRLELAEVDLPDGVAVPAYTAPGPTLVGLLAGGLALTAGDDGLYALTGGAGVYTQAQTASLAPGDGALVPAGRAVSAVAGAGGARLLLATITAGEAGPG